MLKKEAESKGETWNEDSCCKGFVDNLNIELPMAYVDEHGKVFFNARAHKQFSRASSVKIIPSKSIDG